jgi:phosphoglycerate dehydrogenase-like enzyme
VTYHMKMYDIYIGVCSRSFGKNGPLRQRLGKYFSQVSYYDGECSLKDDALIEFLRDKTVAILGLEKITSKVLDACPNLKVICKMGTGTDKVDINELKKRDIQFFNTPGFNRHAVAELVLTHTLMLVRKMKANIENISNRQWKQNLGGELYGKRIGLVGFGAIGQEVARIFSALGCEVSAFDINSELIKKTEYTEPASKEILFSKSDIITIHIPLLDNTRNFVDAKLIDSMKKGSILINTSRGEIVDQEALRRRLLTGEISAGLDVLNDEPSVDFSLSKLHNTLITPHIGGSTHEAVARNGFAIISFLKNTISNAITL